MVRSFDFGYHRSSIHLINPTPGNPLDPIHSGVNPSDCTKIS
jgi:hypothetical protein